MQPIYNIRVLINVKTLCIKTQVFINETFDKPYFFLFLLKRDLAKYALTL